jgi:hypothetical protein
VDALQGLKGAPYFLDGNAMQESREEAGTRWPEGMLLQSGLSIVGPESRYSGFCYYFNRSKKKRLYA